MSRPLHHDGLDTLPWFRQFWPWFIIALPSTAVIAGFITLWIAVAAAPERIDNFDATAIPVELTLSRKILIFDLGARIDTTWPDALTVTIVPRRDGKTQRLQARLFDGHYYETPVAPLEPGAHDVTIEDMDSSLRLQGSWAYPAPVWKLRVDD